MDGLGKRIKELRKKQGLTIVDVMEKTGIDKATLSRIENGKMHGTVNTHMKIASALGVRLPDLYEEVLSDAQSGDDKITREKVETFSHSSGAVAELLTTGPLQKKMMPILLKVKPGGQTELEEYPFATERFIYVMKGSLKIIMGTDETVLAQGESLYFNAARPHHFLNTEAEDLHCLSVITPVSL